MLEHTYTSRFVPLDTSLEEAYAGNRKRRRLLYALRRHHTHSYASLWDRLANETFIHCQLLFDRCTPRKLRAHLPWACSAYLIVSLISLPGLEQMWVLLSWLSSLPGNVCSLPCACSANLFMSHILK